MTRIYGKNIALNKHAVLAFFERRGAAIDAQHPLTSVLYQDHNPQLAEMRDAHEKAWVKPLLRLHKQANILDIGCGIGRWADAFDDNDIAHYHGVDFSHTLIEAARQRHQNKPWTFQVLAAQDIEPLQLTYQGPFSHILISGVLLYLDDAELTRALHAARLCAGPHAVIYVREPVAVKQRLTLDKFDSSELNTDYSAVYRTERQLQAALDETFISEGYEMLVNEYLYPDQLNNRAETVQKIFIFASSRHT